LHDAELHRTSDARSEPGPPPRLRLSQILAQLCERRPDLSHDGAGHSPPAESQHAAEHPDDHPLRLRDKLRIRTDVSVGEIVDRTQQAGFGCLLGLLALIAVPFVGVSLLFGSAIAFGGAQMLVGWQKPWLPAFVRRRQISLAALDWLSLRVARWTAGLERVVRPRFQVLTRGPFWSLCGLALILQGIGLALPIPIPASNWLFIVPIVLYAIGLLEGDGLLILACHVLTALMLAGAIVAGDLVYDAILKALHWFTA
jgi:hypothetical protein